MANAQYHHACLCIEFIDDQVRAVGVRADRGRDFITDTGGARVFGEEVERRRQAFVVSVGLGLAELREAVQVDFHQIIRRCFR